MRRNNISGDSQAKKMEYLNSLGYDILIRQRKGKFYLYIPEISLVAVGNDLNLVYKDLCQQKSDLFDKAIECGAEDQIPLPSKTLQGRHIALHLKIFALKLLLVCALLGGTFIFGAVVIRDKIANISAGDIVSKVSKEVVMETMKFTNAPDDVKKIRVQKFRQFLETLRPWTDEAKHVFSSDHNDYAK